MKRPFYTELNTKIKQAKEAVLKNCVSVVNPAGVAADVSELGCLFKEISNILSDLLKEITPREYVGQYPPQHSYERRILESDLFAFRWESKRLGCKTYLKFALKENRPWLVSFHQDRKGRGDE